MNVWTKIHGHSSNSFCDILLKTTNVNLKLALEEKLEDHQSQQSSSSGHHEYVHKIS